MLNNISYNVKQYKLSCGLLDIGSMEGRANFGVQVPWKNLLYSVLLYTCVKKYMYYIFKKILKIKYSI